MTSFNYPKHKQKTLEFKVHFESKLILIQWLDEKDWIKLMYIKYITYYFLMIIRPHFCGS
jgi:hypothetical protein